MQFVRPESSFIKSRFILAKNLFKQFFILKKTYFSKKDFEIFKKNYISSMQKFSERNLNLKLIYYFNKILIYILNSLLIFILNKRSRDYILVILNNNKNLNSLAKNIDLKNFTDLILRNHNLEIVFMLHPNVSLFKFF